MKTVISSSFLIYVEIHNYSLGPPLSYFSLHDEPNVYTGCIYFIYMKESQLGFVINWTLTSVFWGDPETSEL